MNTSFSLSEFGQRVKMQQRGKTTLFWAGFWWFISNPKSKNRQNIENGLTNKRWILINDFEPEEIDHIPLMKVRTKSHKMHHQEGGGEIIGHKKHPVNCDCYLTAHALDQHAFVMNPRFAKQKKIRPLPMDRSILIHTSPICEEPGTENDPLLGQDFLAKVTETKEET